MLTVTEQRRLSFQPADIFALVADVARYPEFVPGILSAKVTPLTPQRFQADLLMGYQFFRERYTCYVNLHLSERIDIEYIEGPFKALQNSWKFLPAPGGVVIDFAMTFEFRSRLLQNIIGPIVPQVVEKMINSFEKRAIQIYKPVVCKVS